MKNDYYVYLHKTLDGELFYIGKGRCRRAFSKNSRNSKWHEKASNGYNIEFYSNNLTDDEAKKIEIDLIKSTPDLVNTQVSLEALEVNDYHHYFKIDSKSPSGLSRIRGVFNGKYEKGNIGYCGYIKDNNSWEVPFKGRSLKVHRVVWELANGKIPNNCVIDHIDGDSSNNSLSNLRAVPAEVNSRNRGKSKNNNSGVSGVSYREDYNCYTASWCYSDKVRSKAFSANKYGHDNAFKLACEYREEQIRLLNEQGAGYTERHGT